MKSIEKFLTNHKILSVFFIWRIVLIIPVLFSLQYIPLYSNDLLGGGFSQYIKSPLLWGWANFDGEHYMSIARFGYRPLTYFFFPVYPLLIRFFASILNKNILDSYLYSGLFISHLSFLLSIIGISKLLSLDYKKNIVWNTIILLILFPTSFYFFSVYTESIFLAVCVWSLYFCRKRTWIPAVFLASIATATRLIGIAIFPAIVIEILFYRNEKKDNWIKYLYLFLIPLGLIFYMFYLNDKTGNPFEFVNQIEHFGGQRSSNPVLLPQVFYRYIFKILPVVNLSFLPIFFSTWLEFLTGVLFLILSVISGIKLRKSYTTFLVIGYLFPTLSGSFSSLPRYCIVLFPGFLLMSLYLTKQKTILRYTIFVLFALLQFLALALFIRGYWIS